MSKEIEYNGVFDPREHRNYKYGVVTKTKTHTGDYKVADCMYDTQRDMLGVILKKLRLGGMAKGDTVTITILK